MCNATSNSWRSMKSKEQQAPTVCLVRPAHFAFNSETAPSNIFQREGDTAGAIDAAVAETDALASALVGIGVDCLVIEDRKNPVAPDAVFPNNWFSTHADGTVVLYPLLSPLRRTERRMDIFESILPERGFDVRRILDFTSFEARNRFVEGTGSLVFDHLHSTAYVNLSARTDQNLAQEICRLLGYDTVFFKAES